MFNGGVDTVLYLAFLSCLSGIFLLGYFAFLLKRRINDVVQHADRPRKVGTMRGLTTSLMGVTLVSLSLAGFAFCLAFWTYTALTMDRPVAEITCHRDLADPSKMILKISEIDAEGTFGPVSTYSFEGDRWYVGGDVVEWHRYLSFLGLMSSYKIHSVGGQWRDRTKPSTGHNMNGGPSAFTESLMDNEGTFPYSLVIREVNGVDLNRPPSKTGADEHFRLAVTTAKQSLTKVPGPPGWTRTKK